MIHERIRELREKKGAKQEDLAIAMGISNSSISSYESGTNKLSIEATIKFAKYFKVSVYYLLGIIDKPIPLDVEVRLLECIGDLVD